DGLQYHVYTQTNLVTTVAPYDDSAFTYFGTWAVYGPDSTKYGGSDHFTRDPAASCGFLFSGTAVAVYTQTAPWMAIVSFSVDGGLAADFDAYAATATQQVVAFRSGPPAPGKHRILVRNTGRLDSAATTLANGGGLVTVDRADIGNGALIPPLAPGVWRGGKGMSQQFATLAFIGIVFFAILVAVTSLT